MRIQPKLADEPGQRGRHLVAPNGGTQLSQMVAATNAVDVQTPYPVVHSFAADRSLADVRSRLDRFLLPVGL